jgi:hypothetical protein
MLTAYRVTLLFPIRSFKKQRGLMMDREEYKVVWSGPHGEGEYTAVGTFAAFGYGI